VVERVVDDIVHGRRVLLLGLDQLRPEAPSEDVVAAAVALVEGAGVRAVQVAHPIGEVGKRRLDDQVIVVPHQTTGVDAPLVAAPDPAEDVQKDRAVPVVDDDWRMVVSPRPDVVVGTGGEEAMRSRHVPDRSRLEAPFEPSGTFRHRSGAAPLRARHPPGLGWTSARGTRPEGACP
jgi:hypothetical protein